MGQHDGIVVDGHDPGVGLGPQGDRVDVVGARDARADVEELADAGLRGQPPHRTPEERSVRPGLGAGVVQAAEQLADPAGGLAVSGEVVRPAQQVVVDPGGVGHVRVDLDRRPRGLVCHGMPLLASDGDASQPPAAMPDRELPKST